MKLRVTGQLMSSKHQEDSFWTIQADELYRNMWEVSLVKGDGKEATSTG